MVGKEFITKEILEDWKYTIECWIENAHAWGAKAIVVVYDEDEREFKPLNVFPEQSIPVFTRSLVQWHKAVGVIQLDSDISIESILTSICHFFEPGVEN